ncbi:MAG: 6-phosphofructokinase [Armatimonadetes bacterium]|nr:6-phosphofructokinase [Armatimonadota bacterium]
MKVAGLLTNGGDTCSLNALLRYSRDSLRDEGFTKIWGFEGGYRGLITGAYRDITDAPIDPHSGGTFLLSLRDSPTPSPEEVKEVERWSQGTSEEKARAKARRLLWSKKLRGALNTLKERQIDVLVVLGGNGTISATVAFAEHVPREHNLLCIPRTIDNDVNTCTQHVFEGRAIQTSLCPGYPSAAEKVVRAARSLRTTAASTRRIFTLETMGRDAGWLALASTLGWAEIVSIPEVNLVSDRKQNEENKKKLVQEGKTPPQAEVTVEQFCKMVTACYESGGCRNMIIGVSEGTMENCQQITMTQYGSRKLGGAGDAINRLLTQHIRAKEVLVRRVHCNVRDPDSSCELVEVPEVRCQHTDYGPRMGEPSGYDVQLAEVLAYKKLRCMLDGGEFQKMPVLKRVLTQGELMEEGVHATDTVDIRHVQQMLLPVEPYYDSKRLTSTKAFDDFLYMIVGRGLLATSDRPSHD